MAPLMIPGREGISLSSIRQTDKPALLEHLHSRDVYNTTMNIPHPYLETDADSWIHKRIEHANRIGLNATFAIRNQEDTLIGAVGADNLEPGTHLTEMGYWLARPYWNQGIMTRVVRAYINYAFDELQLSRLVAHVLESNIASARVLEKNGFKLEGRLREHFRKDGKLLDARFYGLLREDVDRTPPGH